MVDIVCYLYHSLHTQIYMRDGMFHRNTHISAQGTNEINCRPDPPSLQFIFCTALYVPTTTMCLRLNRNGVVERSNFSAFHLSQFKTKHDKRNWFINLRKMKMNKPIAIVSFDRVFIEI